MHRKRVMMQWESRADRQPVKNEKLVLARRPFGSAKRRLNQIAAATAWNGDEMRALAHYNVLALAHNSEASLFERL